MSAVAVSDGFRLDDVLKMVTFATEYMGYLFFVRQSHRQIHNTHNHKTNFTTMKKIFALIAAAAIAVGASAQVVTGGSFGFSHTSLKGDDLDIDWGGSSFKIFPSVGYQLDDQLTVGMQIGFAHGFGTLGNLSPSDLKTAVSAVVGGAVDVLSDDEGMDISLNTFMFAPYARYNYLTLGKKLNLFLEGTFTYGIVKLKGDVDVAQDPKINMFQIAVAPGASYDLTDNVSLVVKFGSLGFQHLKASTEDIEFKLNRFGFDADTYNLVFGFEYTFDL